VPGVPGVPGVQILCVQEAWGTPPGDRMGPPEHSKKTLKKKAPSCIEPDARDLCTKRVFFRVSLSCVPPLTRVSPWRSIPGTPDQRACRASPSGSMHEGTFFLSVFFECSGGLVRSPGGSPRASCTHKICPPGTPGTPGTPRPQTPMSDLLGTGPTPPSPDVRPPGTAAGR